MGQYPDAADNWLREAYENQIPVIHFLGIAPGLYQALVPTFIVKWDANLLKARVAFDIPDQQELAPLESAPERRHALRTVNQRLYTKRPFARRSLRHTVVDALYRD
jgi:putative restriction endonuclease